MPAVPSGLVARRVPGPTSGSAHGGVLYTGVSSPLSSAAGVDASLIQSSPLVKARDGLEGAAVAVHVPSPPRLEDPLDDHVPSVRLRTGRAAVAEEVGRRGEPHGAFG